MWRDAPSAQLWGSHLPSPKSWPRSHPPAPASGRGCTPGAAGHLPTLQYPLPVHSCPPLMVVATPAGPRTCLQTCRRHFLTSWRCPCWRSAAAPASSGLSLPTYPWAKGEPGTAGAALCGESGRRRPPRALWLGGSLYPAMQAGWRTEASSTGPVHQPGDCPSLPQPRRPACCACSHVLSCASPGLCGGGSLRPFDPQQRAACTRIQELRVRKLGVGGAREGNLGGQGLEEGRGT